MTINDSSCCNVFDTICSCLDSLFFILFGCVGVIPVNVYSASYGISENARSKVININPMMAVESSFNIQ